MTTRYRFFISVVTFVALSACMPAAQQSSATTAGGQSSPGTSEDPSVTAARARELLGPGASVVEERTVALDGYLAQDTFAVEGGNCYRIGLAWAGSNSTHLSVGFQPGPSGAPVSEAFAARSRTIAAPGDSFEFCADNPGSVNLAVAALGSNGATVAAQTRYAVAIAARAESEADAAVRQQGETVQADHNRAQMDANIQAAEEQRQRNLARRCRDCSADYRLCQVQEAAARQNRRHRPGVSYTTSCEVQYRECSHPSRSAALSAPDEWPCGAPPR